MLVGAITRLECMQVVELDSSSGVKFSRHLIVPNVAFRCDNTPCVPAITRLACLRCGGGGAISRLECLLSQFPRKLPSFRGISSPPPLPDVAFMNNMHAGAFVRRFVGELPAHVAGCVDLGAYIAPRVLVMTRLECLLEHASCPRTWPAASTLVCIIGVYTRNRCFRIFNSCVYHA